MSKIFETICILAIWYFVFRKYIQQPLLNFSLENLPQEKPSNPLIMMLLEEAGGTVAIGLGLSLYWHFLPREKAFIVCLAPHIAALYNAIEKLYFKEARPYFLVDSMPLSCDDHEYGMPSGHAQVVSTLYMTMGMVCFPWYGRLAIISLSALVSWNRYMMGVHSLDQLLHGTVIAFLTARCLSSSAFLKQIHKFQDMCIFRRIFNSFNAMIVLMFVALFALYNTNEGVPSQQLEQIARNCEGLTLTGKEAAKSCVGKALIQTSVIPLVISYIIQRPHRNKDFVQHEMTWRYCTIGYMYRLLPGSFVFGMMIFPKKFLPDDFFIYLLVKKIVPGILGGVWCYCLSDRVVNAGMKQHSIQQTEPVQREAQSKQKIKKH